MLKADLILSEFLVLQTTASANPKGFFSYFLQNKLYVLEH